MLLQGANIANALFYGNSADETNVRKQGSKDLSVDRPGFSLVRNSEEVLIRRHLSLHFNCPQIIHMYLGPGFNLPLSPPVICYQRTYTETDAYIELRLNFTAFNET